MCGSILPVTTPLAHRAYKEDAGGRAYDRNFIVLACTPINTANFGETVILAF